MTQRFRTLTGKTLVRLALGEAAVLLLATAFGTWLLYRQLEDQTTQRLASQATRFDAVLSDEAMPEMNGSELALELRRIRPDIPVVLMTGFITPAPSARAREAGVSEVLAKALVSRDIARSLALTLGR